MARARRTKQAPAAVGQVFAARLREAREARRWTQQQLAGAMNALGAPMDRTTIAKLEKGHRQARVEELVALAAALDVSPTYLLLPWHLDARVKLAPKLSVDTFAALRWARGDGPLDPANERTYRFVAPTVPWVVWDESGVVVGFGGVQQEWEARQLAREAGGKDG